MTRAGVTQDDLGISTTDIREHIDPTDRTVAEKVADLTPKNNMPVPQGTPDDKAQVYRAIPDEFAKRYKVIWDRFEHKDMTLVDFTIEAYALTSPGLMKKDLDVEVQRRRMGL